MIFTPIFTHYIDQLDKTSVVVENPTQCDDFQWLIGQEVTISDDTYLVEDVWKEREHAAPPYLQGTPIGLVVAEYKHKIKPGNKIIIKHDVAQIDVKLGDVGTITAYLPDDETFAIFFGVDKWVGFEESEEQFLNRCETFVQSKRSCPDCNIDLTLIMDHPLVWQCSECKEEYAIMNGQFQVLPAKGKLKDWPEMDQYFKDTVQELLETK